MKKEISNNFLLHASKVPSQNQDMHVASSKSLTYVDSGLSCDTFNLLYIHHPELEEEELTKALNHYQSNDLDYCIWINKESLSQKAEELFRKFNISEQASEVGMALNFDNYQFEENINHLNIRQVKDEESLRTYAHVIAENWTPADQNVLKYYDQTSDQYLDPSNGIKLYIYYHEGEPASCVELFPTDSETVGFYGFATLEQFRGKGIGTTLLTFALNMGKELGYKNAILQGTEDGLNIYKKLGFKDYTTYYEFV